MTAGETLSARALAALDAVADLNGRYPGAPVRGAFPYATVEAGPETDWGHKSGIGREVRLAVSVRDCGEHPARLRRIAGQVESAVGAIEGSGDGWRIVSLVFLRSRLVPQGDRHWLAAIDYRARMLAE